jgi:hypothetical protein
MVEHESWIPRWVPWLPLYRVQGQGLREVLANLACKLRRLMEHV